MSFPAKNQSLPESPTPAAWGEVAEQLTSALAKPDADTQVRAAVRAWCEQARRRQLPPEEFLVAMKGYLVLVPALQQRDDRTGRNAAFERIVTMCIEEYFTTVTESQANATSSTHDVVAD